MCQSGVGNRGVSNVQLSQISQSCELLQSKVAGFRSFQIQLLYSRRAGERRQLRIADSQRGERHFPQFAAGDHGLAAQRCNPCGQRLVAARRRTRRLGVRGRGHGAHEFDFTSRNRRPQGIDAARGHARVAKIDRAQLVQRRQPREPGVGDPAPVKVQLAQMRHPRQHGDALVGNRCAQKNELAQFPQVLQIADAAVGHLHAVEIQLFEPGEAGDVLEPFVGDAGIAQVQSPQIVHRRQAGHRVVPERGVAHVERLQIHERIQTALVDLALLAAQFLQIRQIAERGEAGIGDVEIRKKVQRELKPLQILHSRDRFEFRVAIQLAARARREGRSGKVEFANVLQARQVLEFPRLQHRPGEIDPGDLQCARRQVGQQPDGLPSAIHHDPSALADHPLRGLAIGRRKGGKRNQRRDAYDDERPVHVGTQNGWVQYTAACPPFSIHNFFPGPNRIAPGRAPLCRPCSSTTFPLTITYSTPVAYWCGFS